MANFAVKINFYGFYFWPVVGRLAKKAPWG